MSVLVIALASLLYLSVFLAVVGSSEPNRNSHTVANPSPRPDAISPSRFSVYFYTDVHINGASIAAEPFVVDVTRSLSPLGADRLYSLVKDNYFTNATFFRLVPNFVVQFGIAAEPTESSKWNTKFSDEPVLTTNAKWTMTYAKSSIPNSRSTQLFINYVDNNFLDKQGFSPFGEVVSGHETLLSINNPTPGHSGGISQDDIYSFGTNWVIKNYPITNFITHATILVPTASPTMTPTEISTISPTFSPSSSPTIMPTAHSTMTPTTSPTIMPTALSTMTPTTLPTIAPTANPLVDIDISCLSSCAKFGDNVHKIELCNLLLTSVFLDCNSYALSRGTCEMASCASSCSVPLMCEYGASLVYDCFTLKADKQPVGRNSSGYLSFVDTCINSYNTTNDDDSIGTDAASRLANSNGGNASLIIVVLLIIVAAIVFVCSSKVLRRALNGERDVINGEASRYDKLGMSSEHGSSERDDLEMTGMDVGGYDPSTKSPLYKDRK